MFAKELIGVASFMLNKSSKPRLVAIVPQAEIVDEDGDQILPSGMNIVSLPFLTEMRSSQPSEAMINGRAGVTEDMLKAASELISTWQIESTRHIEDFEVIYFVVIIIKRTEYSTHIKPFRTQVCSVSLLAYKLSLSLNRSLIGTYIRTTKCSLYSAILR